MKRISIVVLLSAIVLLSVGTGYWCALSDIDEPEENSLTINANGDYSQDLEIYIDYNWTKRCPIVFYNNSIEFINHNETHHRFDIVKNNTIILSAFVDKNTSSDLQEFFELMIYEILRMDEKLDLIASDDIRWRT